MARPERRVCRTQTGAGKKNRRAIRERRAGHRARFAAAVERCLQTVGLRKLVVVQIRQRHRPPRAEPLAANAARARPRGDRRRPAACARRRATAPEFTLARKRRRQLRTGAGHLRRFAAAENSLRARRPADSVFDRTRFVPRPARRRARHRIAQEHSRARARNRWRPAVSPRRRHSVAGTSVATHPHRARQRDGFMRVKTGLSCQPHRENRPARRRQSARNEVGTIHTDWLGSGK